MVRIHTIAIIVVLLATAVFAQTVSHQASEITGAGGSTNPFIFGDDLTYIGSYRFPTRVGIGITPTRDLDVVGTGYFDDGGNIVDIHSRVDSTFDITQNPTEAVKRSLSIHQGVSTAKIIDAWQGNPLVNKFWVDWNGDGFFLGDVGIGVAASSEQFLVKGPAGPQVRIDTTDGSNPEIYYAISGVDKWLTYIKSTDGAYVFRDAVGAADRVVILPSGNVGIGTTVPGAALEVHDGTAFTLTQTSKPTLAVGLRSDNLRATLDISKTAVDGFRIENDGATDTRFFRRSATNTFTNLMVFDHVNSQIELLNSNVGIGTTGPTAKLEVLTTTPATAKFSQTGATNNNIVAVDFSGGNVGSTTESAALFRVTSNSNLRPLMSLGTGKIIADAAGDFYVSNLAVASCDVQADSVTGKLLCGAGAADNDWTVDLPNSRTTLTNTGHNVGIGIAVPGAKLDVLGKISGGDATVDYLPAAANWAYTLQLNALDTSSIGFHDSANDVGSIRYKNRLFTIGADDGWGIANTYFAGDVGIGTIAPGAKLEVAGQVKITGGVPGAGKILTDVAGTGLATWETPAVSADSDWTISGSDQYSAVSGNVGIGTATPFTKFDVEGKANVGTGTQNSFFNSDIQLQVQSPTGVPSAIGTWVSGQGAALLGHKAADQNFYITNMWATATFGDASKSITLDSVGKVGIGTTAPTYKLETIGDIYANGGWFRVSGNQGLYFESYGGGWYMIDGTWIRSYGSKSIYQNAGILRTDGTFQVGNIGSTLNVVNAGNFAYRTNVLFANTAGNVGIGNAAPGAKLEVTGQVKITGGTPGVGKVLTSDAVGLASWQTPASSSSCTVYTMPVINVPPAALQRHFLTVPSHCRDNGCEIVFIVYDSSGIVADLQHRRYVQTIDLKSGKSKWSLQDASFLNVGLVGWNGDTVVTTIMSYNVNYGILYDDDVVGGETSATTWTFHDARDDVGYKLSVCD